MSLIGNKRQLVASGTKTIAIASQATIYTNSFKIEEAEFFGLWIKTTSVTGTPDITVNLEMSHKLPTTEGAADLDWVTPESQAAIFTNLADELAHVISISPVPMNFARFRVLGNAGNTADAIIEAYIFTQGNV